MSEFLPLKPGKKFHIKICP